MTSSSGEFEYIWPNPKNKSDEEWPPELRSSIRRYLTHLYDLAEDDNPDARSVKTVKTYQQDLHWFESFLQLNNLEICDISNFQALDIGKFLGKKYSGSTAGTRYRNLRRLCQFLYKGQELEFNPFSEWDYNDLGIYENRSEQSKHLDDGERYGPTIGEIRQMEENTGTNHRLRNQLVIRLLFHTGCRCNEIRQIRLDNIDQEEREIYLPREITKYNISRTVAYKPSCDGLLNKWLNGGYREMKAYGGWSEYLFPTDQSPKISTDTVEDIVTSAANRAGINKELWRDANGHSRNKITPHNIRYSTGYYMLFTPDEEPRPDTNIFKVSNYLGHSSVTVTERIYIDENPRAGVDAGHELMPE